MKYLVLFLMFLASPAIAQQWKAGATLSGWQGDASIAAGGTVAQTGDPAVPYNMHRWGEFTLNAPVTNGRYTVKLHFREPSVSTGERVFHVELEGARVETAFDVAKLAGSGQLVRTYTVDVADGNVTAKFIDGGPGNPMYSALEVSLVTPAPPTGPTWTGSQGISWTPPTHNSDGSVLNDLAGYVIEYGSTATALNQRVRLANPGLVSYMLTGLPQGRYFLGLRAFNTAGIEGDRSNLIEFQLTESVPACPSKPADETQVAACVAPAVGSWTRTRTFASAVYPTCWTPSAWLPANAPSGACVIPAGTWKVRAASAGTRPAYELVRNQADTAWVRGYKLGDITVGKPCDLAREIPGTSEYHKVAEADVTLLSPTYSGRTLVAICAK